MNSKYIEYEHYPLTYFESFSWKIHKKSLVVTVTEGNTDLPPKSLLVQGYDVVGAVKSEGEPVRDTLVLLYQKGNVLHHQNDHKHIVLPLCQLAESERLDRWLQQGCIESTA